MTKLLRMAGPLLLGLTLLPACRSSEQQTARPETEDAVLEIRNDNFLDVTVYALRDSQRYRLGLITTGNTETFVLSEYLLHGASLITFIADPIGSTRSIFLAELSVMPGDEIFLSVPSRRR